MNELTEKIKNRFKSGKLLFILGIVGIVLISISSFGGNEKSEVAVKNEFNVSEYKAELEKSVKKLVQSITDSKDVTVVITLEGGPEYTYGQNVKYNTEESNNENTVKNEQSYIIITDSSGNEQAVSVYEAYPEVRGVTVVYKGNSAYGEKIKDALSAALGITSKRIYTVAKGGN